LSIDRWELADSRQMHRIIEIRVLNQEAKFLSRFNLRRAANTQSGLRHNFLAQCGPEGSAPVSWCEVWRVM
jgi:hypothetical protein